MEKTCPGSPGQRHGHCSGRAPGEEVDLADSDMESTGFGEWLIVEVR